MVVSVGPAGCLLLALAVAFAGCGTPAACPGGSCASSTPPPSQAPMRPWTPLPCDPGQTKVRGPALQQVGPMAQPTNASVGRLAAWFGMGVTETYEAPNARQWNLTGVLWTNGTTVLHAFIQAVVSNGALGYSARLPGTWPDRSQNVTARLEGLARLAGHEGPLEASLGPSITGRTTWTVGDPKRQPWRATVVTLDLGSDEYGNLTVVNLIPPFPWPKEAKEELALQAILRGYAECWYRKEATAMELERWPQPALSDWRGTYHLSADGVVYVVTVGPECGAAYNAQVDAVSGAVMDWRPRDWPCA